MRYLLLAATVFLVFSCKKDTKVENPGVTNTIGTSGLELRVVTFDSLGQPENSYDGVTVTVYQGKYSAVTNTAGVAVFKDIPAEQHVPVFTKTGYEQPRTLIDLAGKTQFTTNELPMPRRSTYSLLNYSVTAALPDIIFNFNLDKPVPAGTKYKIAFFLGTNAAINGSNYTSVDIVEFTNPVVSNFNMSTLPNCSAALANISANTTFYVVAVPVSYGLYNSNLFLKPVVLGTALNYPAITSVIKN